MSEVSDRKRRRIERIRNEIMDASIDIIAEKGFKNATTKEIAKKADMAEGTLYNYFKSKNDILIAITERYVSYKRNITLPENITSMEDFLLNLYKSNANDVRKIHNKDYSVINVLLPELLTDKVLGKMYYERVVAPYLSSIEKEIEKMQEKGHCIDIDPKIISRILYSVNVGFAVLDINEDPVVKNASDAFRRDTSQAFIHILGKGLNA